MRIHPLALAITATVLLGAGKLAAASWTGSQAVYASGADSLADGAVSALNLWMMRQAARPADEGHPYGHGKAEALAGLAQVVVLAGIVAAVAWAALTRLYSGSADAVEAGPAIGVMVFSMAGSLAISTGLARAAARSGSLVLASDSVHYRMDLYTGFAVLIGLGATWITGRPDADAVASLLVAGIMSRDVYRLAREAVGELMDRPLPPAERATVEAVLARYTPPLRGWHDLRTRKAGPARFVQVRLRLSPELSLGAAHELAHTVETAIADALPEVEVLVHVDADPPSAAVATPALGEEPAQGARRSV